MPAQSRPVIALGRLLVTRMPGYRATLVARSLMTDDEAETYVRHNVRTLGAHHAAEQAWRLLLRYLFEYQYLSPALGLTRIADPRTFFAVDRMSDQFAQGEIGVEWEAPKTVAGRPSLSLGWEHRQFLHNPIRNEDQVTAGLRVRLGKGTRADLRAGFRPQVCARHRLDVDAMPGEAQFRPEVHRRWDVDLGVRQTLGRRTSLDARLEASTRRYRAPFEDRDRESFGGGGALTRSIGGRLSVRGGALYRATWTRNDPWDPDDRSHRLWRASPGITFGAAPFLKAVRLDLDFEWRRFTSTNPDDQDHFGRRDRGGEAQLEIARALSKSVDWLGRATWRWRSSNFPATVADEEGVFEESVFRTGVVWERKQP